MTAKALILAGYGLNCEEETAHAFKHNGIDSDIVHINDLIEAPNMLEQYQILAIPGGFSYGDDTGAGNAYAQKLKLALWEPLLKFVERDTLTIGICNGCQILVNLGLIPALNKYGERDVAVTYNENNRYQCRWIDLKIENDSPWLQNIGRMHIPVAHGEGRFMMEDKTLKALQTNGQIAARYIKPSQCHPERSEGSKAAGKDPSAQALQDDKSWQVANGQFPFNPNGSADDIAAMTDKTGRILAIMPHPERGMFTWQRDDYAEIKDQAQRSGTPFPDTSDGMQIFTNAAAYFEIAVKKSA